MLLAPTLRCESAAPPRRQLGSGSRGTAAFVAQFLDVPADQLDYAKAKIAFDGFVDPACDPSWTADRLDRLTASAWQLTRGDKRPSVRLGAVRTVLYEAGPWNDHKPFAYDQSDPLGHHLPNKLLHNYLRTRLGQCVSMPALFVILAERLGLNIALALAPDHVLVRYTDEAGHAHNIETTSGGHPARNAWFRETFPMTDRSIESGIYLRTLSKCEGIGLLASIIIESLYQQGWYQEVMDVAALLLRNNSLDIVALLSLGSAAGKLLDEIRKQYPDPRALPADVRADAHMLMESNRRCFARAEDLGWSPSEEGE